ncbi:hypothetical protein AB0M39_39860 [Streptomyces sp. NPDC051907]|uniref:hypothetical protein n=1 Tax=Streptomyces sp. NPDC051907 TaxID=3155284 RepID=UPI0034320393
MPTSSTATQDTEFRPGHTVIIEPLEGPCSVACTCGGFLEVKPETRSAQLARFRAHMRDNQRGDERP